MQNTLSKTETIREKIIQAMAAGQDTSDLEKELKKSLLDELAAAEISNLRKKAKKEAELRARAEDVRVKVAFQNQAVESFVTSSRGLVEPVNKLITDIEALKQQHHDCFAHFDRGFITFKEKSFLELADYLPDGLTSYELRNDKVNPREIIDQLLEKLGEVKDITTCDIKKTIVKQSVPSGYFFRCNACGSNTNASFIDYQGHQIGCPACLKGPVPSGGALSIIKTLVAMTAENATAAIIHQKTNRIYSRAADDSVCHACGYQFDGDTFRDARRSYQISNKILCEKCIFHSDSILKCDGCGEITEFYSKSGDGVYCLPCASRNKKTFGEILKMMES